jgi:hypothetical protein
LLGVLDGEIAFDGLASALGDGAGWWSASLHIFLVVVVVVCAPLVHTQKTMNEESPIRFKLKGCHSTMFDG